MIRLPASRLYPNVSEESCSIEHVTSGFVSITYSTVQKGVSGLPVKFQDLFWLARGNLRWFAKTLHACATYDRHNAIECFPETMLTRAGDKLSVMDNGADYGIKVRVTNDRRASEPSSGIPTVYFSFYISLPLAEMLANELLALSAGDDGLGGEFIMKGKL